MANTKSRSRDLGLDYGAGKGDAPRNMSAGYYENFDEIRGLYGLHQNDGFEKVRSRTWRKVYR